MTPTLNMLTWTVHVYAVDDRIHVLTGPSHLACLCLRVLQVSDSVKLYSPRECHLLRVCASTTPDTAMYFICFCPI